MSQRVTYYLGVEPSKESVVFNIWYALSSQMDYTLFRSVNTPGLIVVALTMAENDHNEIVIIDRIVKSTNCQVSMKKHP